MPGPRAITEAEQANLRKAMGLQVYVLIDTPPAIFKARINHDFGGKYNSVAELPFDGVTLGAYTDIEPDMTVLIGSSEGAFDIGTARVRKAPTSSVLYIGETSEIKFADDQYITVVEGYEPWPKHLKIESNGTVKMDYDVAYSDQHSKPDPTPVLPGDAVMELLGDSSVELVSNGDFSADPDEATGWTAGGTATIEPQVGGGAIIDQNGAGDTVDHCSQVVRGMYRRERYTLSIDIVAASHSFEVEVDDVVLIDSGSGVQTAEFTAQGSTARLVIRATGDAAATVEVTDISIKANEEIIFQPDVSPSFVIGGGAVTFSWACDGAAITDETTDQPTFTFDAGGRYVAYCTVSSAYKSFTGVMVIHVLDNASYQPLYQATLEAINVEQETGGYSFNLVCYDDPLPTASVRDHAKVIIWSKDYIDKIRLEQGPEVGYENYLAMGWVARESITIGKRKKSMEFEAHGPHYFLDRETGFPAGLEDTAWAENGGGTPNRWTEMQNLTVDKMVWHFAHWRSTLTRLGLPAGLTGDTRKAAQIPTPFGSIWEQLQQMTWNVILARPCFDAYGRLWVEIEPQLRPDDERALIPTVMTATLDDFGEGAAVDRRVMSEVSRLEISGVYYQNGTGTALGAQAPGDVQARFGSVETVENMALESQEQVIELAGRYAGWRNNPEGDFELTFVGVNRFIGICPAQFVELTLEGDETARQLVKTYNLIPRRIQGRYDARRGAWIQTITLEPEAEAWPAIQMDFPGSDEGEDPGGGGDDPPEPPPPDDGHEGSDTDVVAATKTEVRTTDTFDEATPSWTDKSGTYDGTVIDFVKVNDDTALALTASSLYRTTDLSDASPTWSQIYNNIDDWPDDREDASPELLRVTQTGSRIYILGYSDGGGGVATAVLMRSSNGDTWATFDIAEDPDAYDDFKTYATEAYVTITDHHDTVKTLQAVLHERFDDDTYAPWAVAYQALGTLDTPTEETGMVFDYREGEGIADYPGEAYMMHSQQNGSGILNGSDQIWVRYNRYLGATIPTGLSEYLDSLFGVGNYSAVRCSNNDDLAKDANRVYLACGVQGWTDNEPRTYIAKTWSIWAKPTLHVPSALAADGSIVYVGMQDKIVVSRDGGKTWSDYITDHGANDIIIPSYDNPDELNIIYWSTTGYLYWSTGTLGEEAIYGTALLGEEAQAVPYRICADSEYGFPIFALANVASQGGCVYKLESGGTTITQSLLVQDIIEARSLQVYKSGSDRRIFYMSGDNIHWSDDDGETWLDDRKGNWSGYGGPVKIEALSP